MALKRINKVSDDDWRVRNTYTAPARERGLPCCVDRAPAQLRSLFQLLFSRFCLQGGGGEGGVGKWRSAKHKAMLGFVHGHLNVFALKIMRSRRVVPPVCQ